MYFQNFIVLFMLKLCSVQMSHPDFGLRCPLNQISWTCIILKISFLHAVYTHQRGTRGATFHSCIHSNMSQCGNQLAV